MDALTIGIGSCAVCGKTTAEPCVACKYGVDVNGKESPTYFCSPTCQYQGWEAHKKECRNANDRKQLYRAAMLCKAAFLVTREIAYDYGIEAVEKDGSHLFVTPWKPVDRQPLFEFPREMFHDDDEDIEAVLVSDSSFLAVARMHRLVEVALAGCYTKIEEVNLTVPWAKERIIVKDVVPDDGEHRVLKVKLRDGNTYVFDITGAEYGIYRPVYLWRDYLRDMEPLAQPSFEFGKAAADQEQWENNFRAHGNYASPSEWLIDPVQTSITTFLHTAHFSDDRPLNVAAMVCSQVDPLEKAKIGEFKANLAVGLNRFVDWLKKNDQAMAKTGNPDIFEEFYVEWFFETEEGQRSMQRFTQAERQGIADMKERVESRWAQFG